MKKVINKSLSFRHSPEKLIRPVEISGDFSRNIRELNRGKACSIPFMVLAILSISISFSSCTKEFEELNRSKTTTEVAEPDPLFSRALATGGSAPYVMWQSFHQTCGLVWAQHFTNTVPGWQSDNYRSSPNNSVWTNFYARNSEGFDFAPVRYIKMVIDISNDIGNPLKVAQAKIWQAYIMQTLTDAFGDVPFSEAVDQVKPRYDSQKEIYYQLFANLEEAVQTIDLFKNSTAFQGFQEADIFYGGELEKWVNLANSLRLRMALRISNVDEEKALAVLTDIEPERIIQNNVDNCEFISWPTAYYLENAMGYVYKWNEIRISSMLMDYLNAWNDPRRSRWAEPAKKDGVYRGLQNGQPQIVLKTYGDSIKNYYCNIGPFYNNVQAKTPVPYVVAADVLFMKAEVAVRFPSLGWGDPQSFYEDGIQASMEQFGILDADSINGYTSNAILQNGIPVAFAADDATRLKQIYTQRWLALFPNGQEAWSLVRRTGYPELYPLAEYYPGTETEGIPRRMIYSTSELQYNKENYDAAVRHMGGNTAYTRMWWDGGNE